jgi:transcriptional regulator with XRE-family HTH domain
LFKVKKLRIMTLGEKIKTARQRKKLSQQELGKLSSTHQKNISKYEQDLVVPSALTLKSIAEALGITTDYLLGEERTSIKDTLLMAQFQVVDKMPEDDKAALMKVIAAYIRDFSTRQAYAI